MLGIEAPRRRRLVAARDRRARPEPEPVHRARAPTPTSSAPGRERILLDTGQGMPAYLPRARARARARGLRRTPGDRAHARPPGPHGRRARRCSSATATLRVSKRPRAEVRRGVRRSRSRRSTTATWCAPRARRCARIHTPGHAQDHLCFVLEEEQRALLGRQRARRRHDRDPGRGRRPARLHALARAPARGGSRAAIYPAHGPVIEDGAREDPRVHRAPASSARRRSSRRSRRACARCPRSCARVYAAYPVALHAAARAVGVLAPREARARGPRARASGDDAARRALERCA